MIGPYKNVEEVLASLLRWQKDYFEMKKQRDYYKQQFLDKEEEIRFILGGEIGDRE